MEEGTLLEGFCYEEWGLVEVDGDGRERVYSKEARAVGRAELGCRLAAWIRWRWTFCQQV